MKLKKSNEYLDFLREVKNCSENVFFISSDGDCLNLKSTFCQYLFASICRDRDYLARGRIKCSSEGDYQLLAPYLEQEEGAEK